MIRNFFNRFFSSSSPSPQQKKSSIQILQYPTEFKDDSVAIVRISAQNHSEFGTHAKEIQYSELEAEAFFAMVGKCLAEGLNITILTNRHPRTLGFETDSSGDLKKVNLMERLG